MTTTDLHALGEGARLRELAERATPGPWGLSRDHKTVIVSRAPWPIEDGPNWHDWTDRNGEEDGRFVGETRTDEDDGEANAAFIAAANPAEVIRLLDERDALRAARSRERGALWRIAYGPVGKLDPAGDGGTYILTGHEYRDMQLVAQAAYGPNDRRTASPTPGGGTEGNDG